MQGHTNRLRVQKTGLQVFGSVNSCCSGVTSFPLAVRHKMHRKQFWHDQSNTNY